MEARINMKKRYFDPEAEIIELSVKDIVTASLDTIPGDNDGDEEVKYGE